MRRTERSRRRSWQHGKRKHGQPVRNIVSRVRTKLTRHHHNTNGEKMYRGKAGQHPKSPYSGTNFTRQGGKIRPAHRPDPAQPAPKQKTPSLCRWGGEMVSVDQTGVASLPHRLTSRLAFRKISSAGSQQAYRLMVSWKMARLMICRPKKASTTARKPPPLSPLSMPQFCPIL